MKNKIILSDCIKMLKNIPDNSIPLIITDPPYGIGYHSNHYKDKNPHSHIAHDWNFQIGSFLAECSRVLCDGGALYMFCRWDVLPLWSPYITGQLKLKTVIAWIKDNWSAGDLRGCFGNQYEQILFIVKGKHVLRGKRWSNVWNFPRVPAKKMLHPTQKPIELLKRAILASSDEGDLVVDPFAGSGSTGVACNQTNREYLLCDIDKNMFSIASKRLGIELPNDFEVENTKLDSIPNCLVAEVPDPLQWGLHPEDLICIRDSINNNIQNLFDDV